MTRAYRRRKETRGGGGEYGTGVNWDEENTRGGYSGGVDWGGDEPDREDGYAEPQGYQGHNEDGYDHDAGYDDRDRRYSENSRSRNYYEPKDEYDDYYSGTVEYEPPRKVAFEPYYPEDDDHSTFEEHGEDIYRRPTEDKRGYLEYSEQYRPLTQMDYLSPDAILPGEQYRKKTTTAPEEELYMEYVPREKWRETGKSAALPGIYRLLNIFYEPFILRNFGVKLPLMQLVATLALLELYNITFNLGELAHEGLIYISGGWIDVIPPFLASLSGLIIGLMLSLYPALRKEPKRILKIVLLVAVLILILSNPLLNIIIFKGWGNVFDSLVQMVIFMGKIVLVFIYLSPVVLGIFAIWGRKGGVALTLLSVVLMLLLPISSRIIELWMEGSVKADSSGLFLYFSYAILLFLYIETTESSYKYYQLASEIPDGPENRDQVYFFNKALNIYFLYLFMTVLIGVFLTLIIFNRNVFLGSMGSERLAESMEVTSDFGMLISMIVLFTIIGILIILWRSRAVITKPVRRLYRSYVGYRMRERELLEMEEEVNRLRVLRKHLD